MISFNFQDSNYIHSFENCIKNVRKFYEKELIDFYINSNSNNIEAYKKICSKYNVEMTIRQINQGYINRDDSIEINIPKMLESHFRIYNTCKKTNSEWVLLLEDDVLIKRQIKNWPNSDCGTNREYLKNGGGSIIKREFYIRVYEHFGIVGIENIIRKNNVCAWAGDELKQTMFTQMGATFEKWAELAEPNYYENTDHAIFHGYKDLHKLG